MAFLNLFGHARAFVTFKLAYQPTQKRLSASRQPTS